MFSVSFPHILLVGKVYQTTRLSDGKVFAMKFFGYVGKLPRLAEVEKEIGLMQALKGIPNIVQIEGIFLDSEEGYIPDRESTKPYPVIVMEALQGGDLFDRIHDKGGNVTEKYLATAFRGVVEALHDTHLRCFVHRDLKLENLMYATKDADSNIKVLPCLTPDPSLHLTRPRSLISG
jgi:serine/threonine protein kinase